MPLRPREVIQCDKDGSDIRWFSSALDACASLGVNGKEHIYKSIKYGVVAFGYRWRWADEPIVTPQSYDMRLKPIIAFKDGIDIEYPNIGIASKETGASISHIQDVILTGGQAKGYRFRLAGSPSKPIAKRQPKRKAVVAIDDQGDIVQEWPCAYDAAKGLGVIDAAIYHALNKKYPNAKCKGYQLRYKDEYNKQ